MKGVRFPMTLALFGRSPLLVAALSAVAVVAASTTPAHAQASVSAPFSTLGNQTLVPNGDFENGLTGWGFFNSTVTFTPTTENPLFGTTSARGTINSPFAGPGAAIVQIITGLTPGETYVISAFINASQLTPLAKTYVDMNDIFADPEVIVLGGTPTTQFTYAPFVANSDSMMLRFVVDGAGPDLLPTGSFATADNIAVTPLADFIPVNSAASAAPEPGTLALLAMGGVLGIPAVRRARRRCAA
jgi:hypothetical protein